MFDNNNNNSLILTTSAKKKCFFITLHSINLNYVKCLSIIDMSVICKISSRKKNLRFSYLYIRRGGIELSAYFKQKKYFFSTVMKFK